VFQFVFCLSVLTAVFPGEPGLARFIGDKEMEAVVTTGAVRRTKLQSNRHHRQTDTQILWTGCPCHRRTNSVEALNWKKSIFRMQVFRRQIVTFFPQIRETI